MTIDEIQKQIAILQSELDKLKLKKQAIDVAKVVVWQDGTKLFEYNLYHGKGTSLSHIINSLIRISDPVIDKKTTITIEFYE